MQAQNLLLARHHAERSARAHNGKVVPLPSNLRWCPDGFEFACRNGDIVRGHSTIVLEPMANKVSFIDSHDREIISWCAVANAGIALGPMADNGSRFVNTLKRDYVNVTPLPDAATVLGLIARWFQDYNDNHPHSGVKMRSPRAFIAAQTATARVSGETGERSRGRRSRRCDSA